MPLHSIPTDEQRRHERFEYAVPVWLQPRDPDQPLLSHRPLPGSCVNISLGGMRVWTIAPILASTVHLRFETPDGFLVTTPGQIAWERGVSPGVWEYGVKFSVELLEEAMGRLLPAETVAG
jgi:hypothetical protein